MEMRMIEIDLDVNRTIEHNRNSFSETPNDILRRIILVDQAGTPTSAPAPEPVSADQSGPIRTRGRWSVELNGRDFPAPNLKLAYQTLLLLLSGSYPTFLEEFAKEKARSRRFVARSPGDIYLASPELAKDHAKPLKDGWYFDTNLSTDQVARRARIAARVCGLHYGKDVRLLNGNEEI